MKGRVQRGGGERLTPFEEAQDRIRSRVAPLPREEVPLAEAYGRVLANDVLAPHPVPPFDNSVVDGFALLARDVAGASRDAPAELEVVGEIPAGGEAGVRIEPGQAARIMTGAPLPESADAVVMLEWTSSEGSRVRVERSVRPGSFIRRAGEDTSAGEIVLRAGCVLGPPEVGMLATLGEPRAPVRRRPLVAVLATGDELLEVGEELAPGKIRSSNDYTLAGQVREAGGRVLPLGIARDDARDLAARMERGREADVLITSGGVSVGDHDRVREVLAGLGFEEVFWRVACSPGKPFLFGTLGPTLVFGLPGNPVSSMVIFENFVRPSLRRMLGARNPDRPRVRATLADPIRGPEDRRHFARVRLLCGPGGFSIHEVRPHGSGNLRSMVNANALAILPEGRGEAGRGETLEVIPLGELVPEPTGGAWRGG